MKNLKLILLTLLGAFIFYSCSKKEEEYILVTDEVYTLIDNMVEFSIFNSENEDLLNPESKNYIDTSSIKLFYVIDGEKKEVYDSNMTYPRNFKIYEHENEYRIKISLNIYDEEDKSITYIQWNENDTDIIAVDYTRTENLTLKNSLWLNDEQILGEDNTTQYYFPLIK